MSLLGPILLLLTLAGVGAGEKDTGPHPNCGDCDCKELSAKLYDLVAPVKDLCSLLPSIRQEISEIKGMLRDVLQQSGGHNSGLNCVVVPGQLVQIDVGNGQVVGVNKNDNIYTLYGDTWTQIPGALIHVTVGAAGLWGANRSNYIYKMVGGRWVKTTGLLKQIDAGGAQFVAGVNVIDDIYSLANSVTVAVKDGSPLPWNKIDGQLKYYSCGPNCCWGVNSADDIYIRHSVTPDSVLGSRWEHVAGKLSMIEIGSDGSVYGVNSVGGLYRRDGISEANPAGTGWTQLNYNSYNFRHVSQDLGWLWLLTVDHAILKCQL